MRIRLAQIKDINRINDLLFQVCLVHHKQRPDLFKYGAKKYTNEELKAIILDEKTPILVAVNEDDIVYGYAFCIFKQLANDNILTDIKTLYIDDLCVDEVSRGQHIGKQLYEAVIDLAKKHSCYNVTLNVWGKNQSALRFYESCGLQIQKIGMENIL